MKKDSQATILREAAKLRLQQLFGNALTVTTADIPDALRSNLEAVVNGPHKTFRYMLLTGLLAAVTDKSLHPRCLQMNAHIPGAFDARSLCQKVIVPFEKTYLQGRLGASNEPFANKSARFAMIGRLAKFDAVRQRLLNGYRRIGYSVRFEVLDSQYYGAPQRRERLIMIGTREDGKTICFPAPSDEVVTARSVLNEFDDAGQGDNQGVCDARITMAKNPVLRESPYAGMLFNGLGRPIDLDRPCRTLPASMGGNKTPIIDTRRLRNPHAPDWLKSVHTKAKRGEKITKVKVPSFMRRITVSEAAALQGFPRDFVFCGSQCDRYKQIGNSVPPPFAEQIAACVCKQMDADHVTAWSKGGKTDATNCQMLCKTHNRAKGNR